MNRISCIIKSLPNSANEIFQLLAMSHHFWVSSVTASTYYLKLAIYFRTLANRTIYRIEVSKGLLTDLSSLTYISMKCKRERCLTKGEDIQRIFLFIYFRNLGIKEKKYCKLSMFTTGNWIHLYFLVFNLVVRNSYSILVEESFFIPKVIVLLFFHKVIMWFKIMLIYDINFNNNYNGEFSHLSTENIRHTLIKQITLL